MKDDTVSRQAATQTVLDFIVEFLGGAFDEDFQKKLMERMNALPSAQPERKTAKDIYSTAHGHCEFKCSACGVEIGVVEGGELDGGYFNFCPKCGAIIEGDSYE